MWRYNNHNDLYHHGIIGQKWGIRRFQNKDGSLTSAGKKKQQSEDSDAGKSNVSANKLFDQSIKGGKDKPNVSPAEKILKETSNTFDNAAKISNSISSARGRKMSNAAQLSDKELKDAVARMNLEKQYNSLSIEQRASGASYVSDILGTVGTVVAIAGSVATVISTVQKIKGG